ncbi:MAG: hypothetical protein NE327_17725 [Lentisphaeraceae bacterium]|nr:hypothetical protein [Lentisphaeraceae bacterium]
MIKTTLTASLTGIIFSLSLFAQEKDIPKENSTIITNVQEIKNSSNVTEKTTDVSENTSADTDVLIKEAGILRTMWNAPAEKIEPSEELKKLYAEREQIIEDLTTADKTMNSLISKGMIWDKERNTEKKGQLDTILDKADRLAFSNELRMSMATQAKVISGLIKQLNTVELSITEQKVTDEKKRQMEAYKTQIELLEKERLSLMEKIKDQESGKVVVQSTEAVQKKREENVEYYTITEDTNLQTIALSYYQDHEKWILIFEHPDNEKVLKQKSPTAIIPIGTVLTIPKETEDQ